MQVTSTMNKEWSVPIKDKETGQVRYYKQGRSEVVHNYTVTPVKWINKVPVVFTVGNCFGSFVIDTRQSMMDEMPDFQGGQRRLFELTGITKEQIQERAKYYSN